MNETGANEARPAVREWLRNERRLGVSHYPIAPPTPSADSDSPAPPEPSRVAASQPSRPPAIAPRTPPAAVPARSGPTRRPDALSTANPPIRGSGAPLDPARTPAQSGGTATGGKPPAAGPLPLEIGEDGLPRPADRELPEELARRALAQLDEGFVRGCRKCVLCEGRSQTVFGVGRARPEIVFVGEGPGADEDRQGEPFVGRAGQLLTRMIAAMSLTRDQVYICNTVKCRPPENRTPTEDEMATCSPYLYRQLAILRPRVIVTLGRPASQSLLATTETISRLRGRFHDFPPPSLANLGLPTAQLMPTFHPAYLLRSPNEKSKAWEDLKQVMEYLGIPLPRGR